MDSILHNVKVPARIWEGPGCVKNLGSRLGELGIGACFAFVDPVVSETSFGEKVVNRIKGSVARFEQWTSVEANTPKRLVIEAANALRGFEPECVVALGGGSTIDLAKAATAVAVSAHSIDQLLQGAAIDKPLPPFLAVPTTCGTGSEGSPYAVVLDEERRTKRGFASEAIVPLEVFLDADVLKTLPPHYLAATGFDALAHALESYVSRRSLELTRGASLGPFLKAAVNLIPSVEGDMSARQEMLAASLLARLLYPRTGLTIAHAISHPLGARYGIHHGAAVAMAILPSCEFNAAKAPERFADLARFLGLCGADTPASRAAQTFVSWLEALVRNLPLNPLVSPSNPTDEEVSAIAEQSLRSSNIPSNPVPLGPEIVTEMVRQCFQQTWNQ